MLLLSNKLVCLAYSIPVSIMPQKSFITLDPVSFSMNSMNY